MSKARITTDEQPSVWQDPLFVALFIINIIVVIVAIVVLLKLSNWNLEYFSNNPENQQFLEYSKTLGFESDSSGVRV